MKFPNLVHFTKDGKGVDKDAPEKPAIVRFFTILWEKRFKVMGVNLLYMLFNLPVTALAAVISWFFVSYITAISFGDKVAEVAGANLTVAIFTAIFTIALSLIVSGPVYAGMTYVNKSFVKGEPIFLWTDFSTKMRSNAKLGLKVGLINGIVTIFLMLDTVIFINLLHDESFSGVLLFFLGVILFFATILFLMMNIFIYQMVVTFKITLKQLYKNAFVFAMIKWLPNLGIILLNAVIVAAPLFLPFTWAIYVELLLLIAVIPALVNFLNNFYAYPLIKKYMIDNPDADKSDPSERANNDLPEFVPTENMQRFVNGRYIPDDEWAEMQKEKEVQDSKENENEEN